MSAPPPRSRAHVHISTPEERKAARLTRIQARKAKGWTRQQLGKRIGRKPSYIAQMEQRGGVTYSLAVAWAGHLGCPIDILL